MADQSKGGVEAEREPNCLLARFERPALQPGQRLALLGVRVFRNLRELAKEEPSAPRR